MIISKWGLRGCRKDDYLIGDRNDERKGKERREVVSYDGEFQFIHYWKLEDDGEFR